MNETHAVAPVRSRDQLLFPVSAHNPRNSEASVVELNDGRLLLAWSEFYGGGSDFSPAHIAAVTSRHGGRTWQGKYILQPNAAGMNVFGPAFLRLRSGALALFYYHQESGADVREYVRHSFDDGQTWTPERLITPDRVRQFMINDRAIQLSTGRVLLPVSWTPFHADAASYRALCWYSDDEGGTWRRGRTEIALPKRGAMEPALVERRDGSLLMVIRTQLGRLWRSESFDGGETWAAARSMDVVGSESPAQVKRIPSTGDLLMVWNHCFDPARSHFGRSPLTAAVSHNDGDTWEHLRDLEVDADRAFAYPSMLFRGDEVLLTYYESQPYRRAAGGSGSGRALKLRILPLQWFYERDLERDRGRAEVP
jgi:sialidase-1